MHNFILLSVSFLLLFPKLYVFNNLPDLYREDKSEINYFLKINSFEVIEETIEENDKKDFNIDDLINIEIIQEDEIIAENNIENNTEVVNPVVVETPVSNTSSENNISNEITNILYAKINTLRNSVNLNSLNMDSSLTDIAVIRANEASYCWSHTRPNGEDSLNLIPKNKWAGENLSYINDDGNSSADDIASKMFTALVNSPSHYDNMVFNEFNNIGIYTYVSQDGDKIRYTSAYMFSS